MRYELKRNSKGMITQCETNADGGNIYARREKINKQALANLERPTPGKLGNLSNLQIFNFNISDFSTGTTTIVRQEYNTTNTFPANATQTIMFGVDGLNNKALYYNILDVKATLFITNGSLIQIVDDSYIEFYLLQNIETSSTNLGTKIPQPAPLSGNGGGAVTFTTDGNEFGNQSITTSFISDSVNVPSNTKGLRASGLALKTIYCNFQNSEVTDDLEINIDVYVDNTSVSTTY
tara:strand:- start:760 stop:1464 length:705 start_codon:yes stop_codon:yes gene_type:complete